MGQIRQDARIRWGVGGWGGGGGGVVKYGNARILGTFGPATQALLDI